MYFPQANSLWVIYYSRFQMDIIGHEKQKEVEIYFKRKLL